MTDVKNVAVLGAGAFGVALTKLAAHKAQSVRLWARDQAVVKNINERRHHPHRLTPITIPNNVVATADLSEALVKAQWIICAVPMAALGDVLFKAKDHIADDAIVVSTAKGIDVDSLKLPCDIVSDTLSKKIAQRACYLSGPSFALELAMDLPTALTVASLKNDAAMILQNGLSTIHCRLYRSNDVVGVCLGGAFKNVIAIAAGACAALALGRNALAALITRGLREMGRLVACFNGDPQTVSGLSGAGDLILSCTDDMSRNHRLGTLLADGMTLSQALGTIGSVVEGAKTARAIPPLEKKFGIDLPIARTVYQVLYEGVSAKTAMSRLLERSLKDERW